MNNFSWVIIHFEEEFQSVFGLAVITVEVVKGDVLNKCLKVCVSACAHRREIAVQRKEVLFLQGSWQTHSSLLSINIFLLAHVRALCSSPPLSICLPYWDGRNGDHSWASSPAGLWEHLGKHLQVWCSPCMTCSDLSQRCSVKHHQTPVCTNTYYICLFNLCLKLT